MVQHKQMYFITIFPLDAGKYTLGHKCQFMILKCLSKWGISLAGNSYTQY